MNDEPECKFCGYTIFPASGHSCFLLEEAEREMEMRKVTALEQISLLLKLHLERDERLARIRHDLGLT